MDKIPRLCVLSITALLIVLTSCKKKNDSQENAQPDIITTVTDIDGNIYNTVTLGTQTWMAENLKTTKYRNGDPITFNASDTNGAYWENSSLNYGRYYNWYAVMNSRNIAPVGWHVPTSDEWTILTNYLASNGYGGTGWNSNHIAKSMASKTGWANSTATDAPGNNQAINNKSGFNAFPGGYCIGSSFTGIGEHCHFWSTTVGYDQFANPTVAYNITLDYNIPGTYSFPPPKSNGLPVRCVKD
jgi:uncharacterized protein (TIGR02145 family)